MTQPLWKNKNHIYNLQYYLKRKNSYYARFSSRETSIARPIAITNLLCISTNVWKIILTEKAMTSFWGNYWRSSLRTQKPQLYKQKNIMIIYILYIIYKTCFIVFATSSTIILYIILCNYLPLFISKQFS